MKTRHQKGYLYKKGGWWYVRYYDYRYRGDGSVYRAQLAKPLVEVGYRYRSKKSVLPLVEEFLRPLNSATYSADSNLILARFVDEVYLPFVDQHKRPSTARGYRNLWKEYLQSCCSETLLREFRTRDGEKLLADIAAHTQLSKNTWKHIKSFLSGAFKHAKRQGYIDGVNPMQDVSVQSGREPSETYAYSLEEIMLMVKVLPEPAATAIATAAFTGMRKGELRGVDWADYDGKTIAVRRSVWQGYVSDPKNRKSRASVPVIAPLAKKLDLLRFVQRNPSTGLVFFSRPGHPLDFNNLVRRVIRPALKDRGVGWHGWHAFRRGLATNLHQLGVKDKTIQAILRHADISTTMNAYVKSVPAESVEAMRRLERVCTQYAPNRKRSKATIV